MTKLTVNRLAHALDDLASHMDVDQFALASLTDDHKEGVAASWNDARHASREARVDAAAIGALRCGNCGHLRDHFLQRVESLPLMTSASVKASSAS